MGRYGPLPVDIPLYINLSVCILVSKSFPKLSGIQSKVDVCVGNRTVANSKQSINHRGENEENDWKRRSAIVKSPVLSYNRCHQ